MKIIEVENLQKKYSNFLLDIKNLTINEGMVVGILGNNQTGKTTFIKCLLGIIKNYKGTVNLNVDYQDIGIVLDNVFFPDTLKPQDIALIMQDIYNNWDQTLYNNYLQKYFLTNKKIKTLKIDEKKKLEIIVALAHHPKLLVIDDITTLMDSRTRREIIELLLEYLKNKKNTLIISTHNPLDLEHLIDRIIILDKGKIIFDEDYVNSNYATLECKEEILLKLNKEDIISLQKNRDTYQVLIKNKHKYLELKENKINLEDLIVLITKGASK